jgi:hypothetical protein
MASKASNKTSASTARIGCESRECGIGLTADKLCNNMDAAEYKHVVLANGPAPAGSSNQSDEGDPVLRDRDLFEADLVDCMVALPGQLFDSTQIPVCLWFCGKNNTLDSENDARLFDGETQFSLVA